MLQTAVDRLGGPIGGAGAVEVGQDVDRPAIQRPAQLLQLDQLGRDPAPQRVDHLRQHRLAGGLGAAPVGGDDLLIHTPGGLEFDMLIRTEDSIELGPLARGEQIVA